MATKPLKPTAQNISRVLNDLGIRASNTRAGLSARKGYDPNTVEVYYNIPLRSVRRTDAEVTYMFTRIREVAETRGLAWTYHEGRRMTLRAV